MSKHYVSRHKYSHDTVRKSLFKLLNDGKARIIASSLNGWCFETLEQDYRVSRKGRLVKL